MSTPTDAESAPHDVSPAGGGIARHIWNTPLWVQAGALGIVLLIGMAITVPGHAYFSDEGAAIIQERQLRAGDGWIYQYPFAAADPEGDLRPFINGQESTDGVAPYAKHPLFVAVLGAADGAFGATGLVLVSVAGGVLAALGAGLIGGRIDRRLGAPTLWVTGVASPLFFDAYLVLAHTIAAAAAVYAVLLALTIVERKAPPSWMYVLLAAATAATVLLRSEGLVLVPAVVVGAIVVARMEPSHRVQAIRVAIVVGVAGVAAFVGERAFIAGIVGDVTEGSRIVTENWLAGRFSGLYRTWFSAAPPPADRLDEVTMLAPVILAIAAFRAGQTRNGTTLVIGLAAVAVLLLPRLTAEVPAPIPGLVVAFPIGWSGLWMLRMRHFTSATMRFVGVVGLLMILAVALTQFSRGAGVEWGGRYFAIALPIVTPVLLRPWLDLQWNVGMSKRSLPVALIAVTIVLSALALVTLRQAHSLHRDAAFGIATAMAGDPPPPGERGVAVITQRLGPQIVWTIFEDYDWLAPARVDIDQAGLVLDEESRTQAVFVDTRESGDPGWPGWTVVATRQVRDNLPIYSLLRR